MRRFPLKPLKRKDRPIKPFAVCDIESTKWTGFLVIGYYDGHHFKDFRTLKEFFAFLQSRNESRDIFAHFGGIFDFIFLLQEILSNGWKVYDFIPRGSGILSFKVNIGGHVLVFRDSSALLPFSLDRITTNFGVAHKKQSINHETIVEVTPQLLTYLEFDCRGLYESLEKFWTWPQIKQSGQAYTLASQALRILRTYLSDAVPALSKKEDTFVRKAYFGGRTEIFIPFYESKTVPLNVYDVNSLYPFCMLENMPGKVLGFTHEYSKKKQGFYNCEVQAPIDSYIPCLGILQDGKYLFPTGEFEGVYSTIEIEYAKTQGYKIRTGEGITFESAGPIFKEYVQDFYKIREKSEKDSVDNTIAKLLLNSLYGRFGLRTTRENLAFDSGQTGVTEHLEIKAGEFTYRLVKTPKEIETFTHVGVAAWVTSLARIHMHKIFMEAPNEIFYTDTDSLFTTRDLIQSTGLGGLKLEYRTNSACFLLPKTYISGEGSQKKIVMKGFDKKKIQHFTLDDFKSALEGDLKHLKIVQEPKFAKIRTALKTLGLVSMTKASTRQIRSKYDKREVYKEHGAFKTRPLIMRSETNGKAHRAKA